MNELVAASNLVSKFLKQSRPNFYHLDPREAAALLNAGDMLASAAARHPENCPKLLDLAKIIGSHGCSEKSVKTAPALRWMHLLAFNPSVQQKHADAAAVEWTELLRLSRWDTIAISAPSAYVLESLAKHQDERSIGIHFNATSQLVRRASGEESGALALGFYQTMPAESGSYRPDLRGIMADALTEMEETLQRRSSSSGYRHEIAPAQIPLAVIVGAHAKKEVEETKWADIWQEGRRALVRQGLRPYEELEAIGTDYTLFIAEAPTSKNASNSPFLRVLQHRASETFDRLAGQDSELAELVASEAFATVAEQRRPQVKAATPRAQLVFVG